MLVIAKYSQRAMSLALLTVVACSSTGAIAQERGRAHEMAGMSGNAERSMGEPMRAPRGYNPPMRPPEVANRPRGLERPVYNHNFTAPRGYAIGPYHAPHGFRYRRYGYGEFLPRAYWTHNYFLADYWLFGLDMPPIGYEWVRYGPDALLIDDATGEIVQVVYGVFI